jgi:hypothetical protein
MPSIAADFRQEASASDTFTQSNDDAIRHTAAARGDFLLDSQESLRYIAEQTGGLAVVDNNDLAAGMHKVVDDVRSYYILGYAPSPDTFAAPGKTPRLHKISVRVKRPGLRVRTRKEFLGISDPPQTPGPTTPGRQLFQAATSPFAVTDIPVKAAALSGYTAKDGNFVHALLHIDTSALKFVAGAAASEAAGVDVLAIAFDQDGQELNHVATGFSVTRRDATDDESLRKGVAYAVRVPIPRPGAYQVRFAVRDRASGALGSTGEFVQIADVARGAFALSGIVLKADANGGLPDAATGSDLPGTLLAQQARLVFGPGARLSYAFEVYNPPAPIESSVSIWRGAERVFEAPAATLKPPAPPAKAFASAGGLKLGDRLPSGEYELQVVATTRDAKGRQRTAAQRVGFEVAAKSEAHVQP